MYKDLKLQTQQNDYRSKKSMIYQKSITILTKIIVIKNPYNIDKKFCHMHRSYYRISF